MSATPAAPADLRIVLFSGGRGSGALAELVAADPRIALTIAINGYDDGASTGEVRRFLGDALGPSDFRKNASRLATLRKTCAPALVELLDRRLPDGATAEDIRQLMLTLEADPGSGTAPAIDEPARRLTAARLRRFDVAFREGSVPLSFGGAAVGNFVFAGAFLEQGRDFNAAVDDYAALVGLPPGLIENVTDGANAFLVALDTSDRLLGSEEEIVDAKQHNRVSDIFLIDRPLDADERARLGALPADEVRGALGARAVTPQINPRLVEALSTAHVIIYAPGTQHSSLFPSYLTPGLSDAISANLEAVKLLVTNIQTDAEITGRSAVDLVDRAVFYLRDKGRRRIPAPCLITHCLLNDPAAHADAVSPYVPLGRLDSLEDPRLVRVGNYEAGGSGRHDAAKVLAPFLQRFLARERSVQRVAVVLYETQSANKVAQTVLEMVRGGIRELKVDLTVFHGSDSVIDDALVRRLPLRLRGVPGADDDLDREVRVALASGGFDYVILFDSSGMYNGEDVARLAGHLTLGRLDAVWGSRRLSVRDIEESYRLKYEKKAVLGAISRAGSHLLSLLYLGLYGRYISDTLSGARAIRAADALALKCPLTSKLTNQHLLPILLRRRAEMQEIPVQFFSISPERVRRTSVVDGLRAIGIAVAGRFGRRAPQVPVVTPPGEARHRAWTGS